MPELLIDVPYYRQVDLRNGLNSYWQNRSCGIVALKMILDFYRQKAGRDPVEMGELFARALENGGTAPNGDWYHATLVKTAISYGLLAWRRSWQPADRDKQFFKAEGVDDLSVTKWVDQVKAEALPTLLSCVAESKPVIISAAKNFNNIDRNHDVVLVGVRKVGGKTTGLYFNDPYVNPKDETNHARYVPLSVFIGHWTYRAIFVEPKGE